MNVWGDERLILGRGWWMSEVMNVRGDECLRWWMSEVMNVRGDECLILGRGWWMSEVMNVWGDECLRWWTSEVMNVRGDECLILGRGWWTSEVMNVWGDECRGDECRTIKLFGDFTIEFCFRYLKCAPFAQSFCFRPTKQRTRVALKWV